MTRQRLSTRRRRLRWTLFWLSSLVIASSVVWLVGRQRTTQTPYRPDEVSSDITSDLAKQLPADAPRPRFSNVTKQAGLAGFQNFGGARTSQLPEDMGPGLAWGDYDNDGDEDLFLVSAGGALNCAVELLQPSRFYENLGQGEFRLSAQFPELRVRGMSAAWGDADGDGFMDLLLSGYNVLQLWRNEGGTGRFSRDERLAEAAGFWASGSWGDYDNDRRLDFYLCGYVVYTSNAEDRDKVSSQLGSAVPFTLNPSAFEPAPNRLYHQNADGTFTDVAGELGVANPQGRSLGGLWHDFDQDGWLDLYVANDVSDNVFYRNLGQGKFQDISHPALVADYRSAMGLAVGDYDRDGDDDMHVTHWVAQENGLYENTWAQFSRGGSRSQGVAENSSGGRNYGLRFMDVADQRGVGQIALPFVGWGTEFVDLDHDGWLDLLVANGNTLEAEGPFPRKLKGQELFLFWNRRGEHFYDLASLDRELAGKHVSRGLACADFDNDGDMDFAVADLGAGVRLLRNDMAKGDWLKLQLRSKNAAGVANGFGEGTVVTVWIGSTPLRRAVGGVSYLSQSSHVLHWGIPRSAAIDRIEIRWHAGATNVLRGLQVNRMYEIREASLGSEVIALEKAGTARAESRPSDKPAVAGKLSKDRVLDFWKAHRAGMDAMKVEKNPAAAVGYFRQAIDLDPAHEDARYYLSLCLAAVGKQTEALTALGELQSINPSSHRAWQQWGVIRALHAASDADLALAEAALLRAQQLNPEETGALMVLGEVALLRGQLGLATERLIQVTRTNPRAASAFFLLGYLAWRTGELAEAERRLGESRQALGPDWQPKGSTSEGDVLRKQHVEKTPLLRFSEAWDGAANAAKAFEALDAHLRGK